MTTTAPDNYVTAPRSGLREVIRLFGVPVYAHWSFLIGGLILSTFAGGGVNLIMYCSMAYSLLILVHESGHALAARLMSLKVHAIYISGLGGRCMTEPPHSIRGAFFLYSGGLLAQVVLFAGTALYIFFLGWPKSTYGACVVNTFTLANPVLFVGNLFPGKISTHIFTDGEVLWKLAMHVLRRQPYPLMRNPAGESPLFPPGTSLLSMPGMAPPGFKAGLEILNDNKTPMDFVVGAFKKYLGLDDRDAIKLMLEIHKMGGVLVPQRDMNQARALADAITAYSQEHSQPLVCRAVEAR